MTATSDGAVLLANVHVGGVPRSTDGGVTWHPTIAIDSDVHEVRAHPNRPCVVMAAAAIGLCTSRDGGATWNVEQEGLHASYCSAVAFAGDDVLLSASVDHFAAKGAIYRRRVDGDGPLVPSPAGCPHGSTASPTPIASPRTVRQPCSLIGRATSIHRGIPAAAGRARPTASPRRAASSSSESRAEGLERSAMALDGSNIAEFAYKRDARFFLATRRGNHTSGIFFWNLRVRAASVVSHFSSRSMPFLKTSTSGGGTTDQSMVCFPQSGRRPS